MDLKRYVLMLCVDASRLRLIDDELVPVFNNQQAFYCSCSLDLGLT